MKKNIIKIIFIILSLCFFSVSIEMGKMPSTYEGAGRVIVENTINKTGATNTVTATVFDFRGYDTLGESFVLFAAICGTVAVLRKNKKEVSK